MGIISDRIMLSLINKGISEHRVPHYGRGYVRSDSNLLLLGGTGPRGTGIRQDAVINRIAGLLSSGPDRGALPGILLCGDPDLSDYLLECRNQEPEALRTLIFLGTDIPYDPLAGARSAADASHILGRLRAACQSDTHGLQDLQHAQALCTALLQMLENNGGAQNITYQNLESCVQNLIAQHEIQSFLCWCEYNGMTATDADAYALSTYWNTGVPALRSFFDPIARSIGGLQSRARNVTGASVETLMAAGYTVVCTVPPVGGAYITAAIGAELENLYASRYGFNLMAYDVMLPEIYSPIFSPAGAASAECLLSYSAINLIGLPLQTVLNITDTVCCLGLTSMSEAETLISTCIGQAYGIQPNAHGGKHGGIGWNLAAAPKLMPDDLVAGRVGVLHNYGIPDGSACLISGGRTQMFTELSVD